MKKIRIGNTVALSWEIFIHDGDEVLPYDLTGKAISVYLINAFATVKIEDFITEDNVLSFTWEGSEQRFAGVYQLTLVENENTDTMLTFDECEAFELVRCSCSDDEDEDTIEKVELSSKLNMVRVYPIVPQIGENGNWHVDGIDTGKPSSGKSAYEYAKEKGYTGTEAEYAAECLAIPVLNEESRTATSKATTVTEGAISQLQAVSSYMNKVATPTIANAEQATTEATAAAENATSAAEEATTAAGDANVAAENAYTAANRADTEADRVERGLSQLSSYMSETVSPAVQSAKNAAAEATASAEQADKAVEDAIEAFGSAIDNKADLENGKIIASQLPDYILGQVMFGGIIDSGQPTYMDVSTSADFRAKFNYAGEVKRITSSEYGLYNGVYFISKVDGYFLGNGINTGDWIISTGNAWKKVDNSDAVTSVAGLVGHVNASSLAAALADITDSNSLARKTDLPKKLSDLEIDIEIESDNSEIKEILSTIVDEEGYLYSNGEKVDMRFTRSLLPVGTAIPAQANLNSKAYLKIGKYYCSLNVDAKTITNCPTSEAFSMEVFNPLGTNVDDEDTRDYTYRLRVLTAYKTGVQYIQYCATSGTAGSWTYNGWFVVPRTSFSLASIKNGGSAAKGASNRGVYIDSTGTFQQMGYTVAKSVPSNAVFTDTNTKVTAVGNHYAPAEDEAQQIDAPDGEVVTGIKRDAAGHVVGVVSAEAGDSEYESAIADKELTTPSAVGGIAQGTKVSDLEGKTFAEMFDDLLFPTVNPTFTAPSASIAFKSYGSTQEIGATGPTSSNFTTGYSAGEITLNGTKQASRGGAHDTANSFIYVNGSASNKTLPSTVALGSTTFKYRAAFGEGPQPKNNKGGNYDSPLAAGTVDSSQITLNGTYPWYATTATAGTLTKQSLIAWNATAGKMSTNSNGFEVKPHTAAAPQMFKIPRQVSSIQIYNSFAGKWESDKISNWDESTSSETINGNTRTYYTYTYNGDARGAVKLIVKF